jgi:hypothetical protein
VSPSKVYCDYKDVLFTAWKDCVASVPTRLTGAHGSGLTTLATVLLGWTNMEESLGQFYIDLAVNKNTLVIVRSQGNSTADDVQYQQVSVKCKDVTYVLSGEGVIPWKKKSSNSLEDRKGKDEQAKEETHSYDPCFSIGLHVKDDGVSACFRLVRIPEINTSVQLATAIAQRIPPTAEQVGDAWDPMKVHYMPSDECLDIYRNACISQLNKIMEASTTNGAAGKRMPIARVSIKCPINVAPLHRDDWKYCVEDAKRHILQTIGEEVEEAGFLVTISTPKGSNNMLRDGYWSGVIVIRCAN